MDPQVIGAVATGIAAVLTPVFGYLLNRQRVTTKAVSENVKLFDARLAELQDELDAAVVHVYELRGLLAAHINAEDMPPLPDELTTRRSRRRKAAGG